MAWHIPIASGAEGFFWLIVAVFVIISQIVKASRKNKSQTPEPGQKEFGNESPEEELRDFLKRLSQGADQPSAPRPQHPPAARKIVVPARSAKPPPLPVRAAKTTTSSQAGATRTKQQAVYRPTPVIQAPAPQPAVAQAAAEPAAAAALAAATPTVACKRRSALVADLKHRECLREAILLREILGPPLALRRLTTHAFVG